MKKVKQKVTILNLTCGRVKSVNDEIETLLR